MENPIDNHDRGIAEGDLKLGSDRLAPADDPIPIGLPPETLLRHMMVLGSSGSGKTVLSKVVVEECVLAGIPVIAIDPQGDLCSLALASDDHALLEEKGGSARRAAALSAAADVVVFTPASRKGVPLSADPVSTDVSGLPPDEQVRAISSIASMIASLLGYRLDTDEGEGLVAVLDAVLTDQLARGGLPQSLAALTEHLESLDDDTWAPYERYLSRGSIDKALRKLARLDVGTRRMLFHEGIPLDIDMLIGAGPRAAALPGRTRVSVVFLNTLGSQEEKEFFLAALVERLYGWMLSNPSPSPQLLLYIDEIAPFMPPVRKPACKDSLSLLFKQARKYGVCCLAATQNPGDVDYKAMAQFGTWALGRLTTRQDIRKIEPTVKALAPDASEAITATLPGLGPGEFLLLCPDVFSDTRALQARWLLTRHETLDEARIAGLTDARWRARFDLVEQMFRGNGDIDPVISVPEDSAPPVVAVDGDVPLEREPATASADPYESLDDDVYDEPSGAIDDATAAQLTEAEPLEVAAESQAVDVVTPAEARRRAKLEAAAGLLARRPSMSAADYAKAAQVGEGSARATLKQLVAEGLARAYKASRRTMFWAVQTGHRPDLGLLAPVTLVMARFDEDQIAAVAEKIRRKPLLGAIGSGEHVDSIVLEHRFVLRVRFREQVQKAFFRRVFRAQKHDEVEDNIYIHPETLDVLVYTPSRGVAFAMKPNDIASEIQDFDGQVLFEERPPIELAIDDDAWRAQASKEKVIDTFKQRFDATPESMDPVFIPVWRLNLRDHKTSRIRIVRVDGITGREVTW